MYPATEPDKSGDYLVSVRVWETDSHVLIAPFFKNGPSRGWLVGNPMNDSNYPVYAWSDIPEAATYFEPDPYPLKRHE